MPLYYVDTEYRRPKGSAMRSRILLTSMIAILFSLVCCRAGLAVFDGKGQPFRLGLNADNWSNQVDSSNFRQSVRDMGIEFIVWHVSPEEFANGKIEKVFEYCRSEGLYYLFNTELVNYVSETPEFMADGGKTRRWDFSDAILAPLREDPFFLGVVHDESLLMQAYVGKNIEPSYPYYAVTESLAPEAAFFKVANVIDQLSAYYHRYGKRLFLETLFPDEGFAAAWGGAVQAPKLLKENYNDLMTMSARGAAREYLDLNTSRERGKELWACVDLWYLDGFPGGGMHNLGKEGGHTPERLYNALVYAWESGYDAAYIEQAKGLMTPDWRLTGHGEKVREFNILRRSRPRPADWRETRTELTVRRFPSGNPGGSMPEFLDLGSYGSRQYRFKDCVPGKKEMSGWCSRDLAWFAYFAGLTRDTVPGYNSRKPLLNFPGLTFNTRSYAQPFSLGPERRYTDMAGLPEINFVDHLSLPPSVLPSDGTYMDFLQP